MGGQEGDARNEGEEEGLDAPIESMKSNGRASPKSRRPRLAFGTGEGGSVVSGSRSKMSRAS